MKQCSICKETVDSEVGTTVEYSSKSAGSAGGRDVFICAECEQIFDVYTKIEEVISKVFSQSLELKKRFKHNKKI